MQITKRGKIEVYSGGRRLANIAYETPRSDGLYDRCGCCTALLQCSQCFAGVGGKQGYRPVQETEQNSSPISAIRLQLALWAVACSLCGAIGFIWAWLMFRVAQ